MWRLSDNDKQKSVHDKKVELPGTFTDVKLKGAIQQ